MSLIYKTVENRVPESPKRKIKKKFLNEKKAFNQVRRCCLFGDAAQAVVDGVEEQ